MAITWDQSGTNGVCRHGNFFIRWNDGKQRVFSSCAGLSPAARRLLSRGFTCRTNARTACEVVAEEIKVETPREQVDKAKYRPVMPAVRQYTRFAEFVGQNEVIERLKLAVAAAKKRGETLDHVLIYGSPGLGKTALAHVIACEMGRSPNVTTGHAINNRNSVIDFVGTIKQGDVVFLDEIHTMRQDVQRMLLTVLQEFRLDTSSEKVSIPPFTLIGATTDVAKMIRPLRDRFPIHVRLDLYHAEDLALLAKTTFKGFNLTSTENANTELAQLARGTPRILLHYAKAVRDHVCTNDRTHVRVSDVKEGLARIGVDAHGFTGGDRRYLEYLARHSDRTVGVDSICAAIDEPKDSVVYMIEPYLLQSEYITRTRSGRQITQCGQDIVNNGYAGKRKIGFQHDQG